MGAAEDAVAVSSYPDWKREAPGHLAQDDAVLRAFQVQRAQNERELDVNPHP